jgi:hypothetical protein
MAEMKGLSRPVLAVLKKHIDEKTDRSVYFASTHYRVSPER